MNFDLDVEGMSCAHCASRVTRAIKDVDPAAQVDVDLAAGRVHVTSNAQPRAAAEAVTGAGYPARPHA